MADVQRWNPTGYLHLPPADGEGAALIEVWCINEQNGQVWEGRLAIFPGGRVGFTPNPSAPEQITAEEASMVRVNGQLVMPGRPAAVPAAEEAAG